MLTKTHSSVSDGQCLLIIVPIFHGYAADFSLKALQTAVLNIITLQTQFSCYKYNLYSTDAIKLFIATTKAEIKIYNLQLRLSEIRGVFQNKLCSLLLQLKFSSYKNKANIFILVPKIIYFFFLEEMGRILKMWPVKENK